MILLIPIIPVLSFLAGQQEPLQASAPQEPVRTLASQRRLVEAYGFEEAEQFPTKLPAPFFRETGRPDHPNFGSVEVDDEMAFAGRWSLRFDVNGGSISVALPPAEVPIFPQSRYLVSTQVRTEGLAHSGARLAVRLHDTNGEPIPGTERTSPLTRTHGEWTKLTIETPVDVPDAADLVFELQLEQPSADLESMPRRIDVSGKVWFDEIVIWQLPRIEFRADPAVGVTRLPETPRLIAKVRDLARGDVSATMRVRDVDGRMLLEEDLDLEEGRAEFVMDLGALPTGWYLGEFEVHDGGIAVARSEQPIAILGEFVPHNGLTRGEPLFGVSLGGMGQRGFDERGQLLQVVRPDYAVLPIWESDRSSILSIDGAEKIEQILDVFFDARVEPVFELASVPSDLREAEHLDPKQVISLLLTRPDVMSEYLRPWMLQFGDEVSRWRVRSEFKELDETQASVLRELALFADEYVAVPSIELAGTLDGHRADALKGIGSVVVEVPENNSPNAVREAVGTATLDEKILQLRLGDPGRRFPRDRAEDFARRLVQSWAAGAPMIESTPPWHDEFESEHLEQPASVGLDATGFVFQKIAAFLSGRPPKGEVPLGRGVTGMLVGGIGEPLLVVWADRPTASFDLGFISQQNEVRVHDVLGRSLVVDPRVGAPRVSLSPAPLFIEGIDQDLVRFRAGSSIQPSVIEPSIGMHDLELSLTNPWSDTVDLRVRPIGPASWSFQPKTRRVSIQPGDQVVVPFEFTYPRTQVDGEIDLRFDVEILDGMQRDVRLLMTSSIQSDKLTVDAEWRITHDGSGRPVGLVVTVEAHNTGSEPLTLEAFTSAPGFLRITKSMPELLPGDVASRSFMFQDGHNKLRGQDLLISVSEFEGDMRVSRRIQIPVNNGSIVGTDPASDE